MLFQEFFNKKILFKKCIIFQKNQVKSHLNSDDFNRKPI
jgi:hypothetical protein